MITQRPITQVLVLGAVVYAVWLLLSGHYDPFLMTVGFVCTVLVVFFALRMEVVDSEGVPVIHLTARIWTYLPWLVVQIFLSNLAVTRIILSPGLPINPKLLRVRSLQRTDLGRVIFANSITLTPGTVTVAVTGGDLHVHALDGAAAGDMDDNEMNRRVATLERKLVS
ncbi:MAG: Na+/H+ antiporter subunit E [Gemmatimonadota bacterium]